MYTYIHILWGAIFPLCVFLSNCAYAQEWEKDNVHRVESSLVHEIFHDAQILSGFAIPDMLPEIYQVPHYVIVRETCGNEECSRYAAAAPNKPILVDSTLDLNSVEDYSFVLHEAIHVLQFFAKGITDIKLLSCNEMLALEKEAYHLQQQYLEKHRAFLRVTWMIDRISCPTLPEKK